MSQLPIKEFLESIQKPILKRYGSKPISRSHIRDIQTYITRQWAQQNYRYPGSYLIADGCSVIGLEAIIHYGKLGLRWKTCFIPGPRYGEGLDSAMPLGYFGDLDLYARYEKGCYAAIVVVPNTFSRYEWRLHEQRVIGPQMYAAAIKEGIKRAQRVNAFCGSKFAHPAPMGNPGLPLHKAPEDAQGLL